MFKYLTKGLLAGIAIKLLDNCRYLSVQVLKIEAAKCYLHGVQMARLSTIGQSKKDPPYGKGPT